MAADPAGFRGAPGRGMALGMWTLHASPRMWQMPLGLSFLLYKTRKPFMVPTSKDCRKN